MSRKEQGSAAEMLGELESAADHLSEWLQTHVVVVAGAIIGLLVAAGLVAWIVSWRAGVEEAASSALAQTHSEYLTAMGAEPGALEVPELANPAAAKQIRDDFEKRYAKVASEHAGTVAGALATVEQAGLAEADGRSDDAIGLLEHALTEAPAKDEVRGLIEQRLAQRFEAAGRWADAAERHEAASKRKGYPLHAWAIADAARCRAMAGDAAAARALYDRLDQEAPDLALSDTQRAQRLELRAAANL